MNIEHSSQEVPLPITHPQPEETPEQSSDPQLEEAFRNLFIPGYHYTQGARELVPGSDLSSYLAYVGRQSEEDMQRLSRLLHNEPLTADAKGAPFDTNDEEFIDHHATGFAQFKRSSNEAEGIDPAA